MLQVGRLQYTGYNCSNFFNGDMHKILDGNRSVAAEVINAAIDKGTSHIPYLDGKNATPIMSVLFSYLNAIVHLKDRLLRSDTEDDNTAHLLLQWYTCSCHLCGSEEGDNLYTSDRFGSAGNVASRLTRNRTVVPLHCTSRTASSGTDDITEHVLPRSPSSVGEDSSSDDEDRDDTGDGNFRDE